MARKPAGSLLFYLCVLAALTAAPLAAADSFTDWPSGVSTQLGNRNPYSVEIPMCSQGDKPVKKKYCLGRVMHGTQADVLCRADPDGGCPDADHCGVLESTVVVSDATLVDAAITDGGSAPGSSKGPAAGGSTEYNPVSGSRSSSSPGGGN